MAFANEGAKLVIVDRNEAGGRATAAQIAAAGQPALFVHGNVAAERDVLKAISVAVETFGTVDVLVNNAAEWAGDGFIVDLEDETWNRVLDGTLKSAYLCCKHVLPLMIQAQSGSIVNIASINGLAGIHLTAYTAAKGGLVAMTRLLAVHYGRHGVRVNAICPGSIETEGVKAAFESSPRLRESLVDLTQLGRIGKPEDIAAGAVYLASDESAFATGSVMVIDGGVLAGRFVEL
jgi:3-oxoacyl-[acyl-carrier protein] reductase